MTIQRKITTKSQQLRFRTRAATFKHYNRCITFCNPAWGQSLSNSRPILMQISIFDRDSPATPENHVLDTFSFINVGPQPHGESQYDSCSSECEKISETMRNDLKLDDIQVLSQHSPLWSPCFLLTSHKKIRHPASANQRPTDHTPFYHLWNENNDFSFMSCNFLMLLLLLLN